MQTGALRRGLSDLGLRIFACFAPAVGLRPDPECRTLVLAGPDGGKFWPVFSASPEYADHMANPLDRWTRRAVGDLASALNARAYYPFGTPHQPFVRWALASGQIWSSPVALLVHAEAGLQVSFRAALAFDEDFGDAPTEPPCDTCVMKPCLSACPVAALTAEGYDTTKCHDYLDTRAGGNCLSSGCLVRRACPVGLDLHDPERAGFHMRAFHSAKET